MQFYNTMSRKKETFTPVRKGLVGVYACGITAYALSHIGHARSAVAFDILVRLLRYKGYEVTFVRNFTDVDDKIIKRANDEGVSSTEIAETYIKAYHEDMDRLGVIRADIEPRATEHIQEMLNLTERLIADGKAYATPSGDVYFRVRSFPGYGKLSGRTPDDLRSGARVVPGDEKEDPLDFALWKSAKPGEPYWESPWGKGRPGWHIECSAMSEKYIPLPLDMATLLKKAVQSHPDGENYLLTGKNVPMEPRTLQYQYQVLLKATGIPYRNFHVLRHTYASRCVERGVDVKSLSEMLGHTDVRTTLQVYVHSSLEHKMRVIQSICFLAPVLDPDCSPSPSPSDHPEAPRYQQLLTTLSQMG